MLDYKYTEPSTKISISVQRTDQRVQRNHFPGIHPGVHSDVSRESYSFEFFDLPLDVPLVMEINQGCMAYVSVWIPLILDVKVLHI